MIRYLLASFAMLIPAGGPLTGRVKAGGALAFLPNIRAERFARAEAEVKRWKRRNWWRMLLTGEHFIPWVCRQVSRFPGITATHGSLYGVATHGEFTFDLGVMGHHLVTTAGKNAIAAAFNSAFTLPNLKYHGFGTGTTAAAAGDTALQTELTTQYAVASTRPTGSQANSTNTYTTVATLTPGSGGTIAVTEWGLLSQAATGGGTLGDHQVFSAYNLVAGSDSLQTTYVLTIS